MTVGQSDLPGSRFVAVGPRVAKPKVSTTIRLSPDVIDHFKLGGRGWQTRIDQALREWIRQHDSA